MLILLDDLRLDAQVRALDVEVVADYARRMRAGVIFPPVVAFQPARGDLYLADGFHRVAAARHEHQIEIDATVRPGSRSDALWFALGAHRAEGYVLGLADRQRAVRLALAEWPDKSQDAIAQQIGCHQSLVSSVVRREMRSVLRGTKLTVIARRVEIRRLLEQGLTSNEVSRQLRCGHGTVAEVRRQLRAEAGLPPTLDRTPRAAAERHAQMAALAASGHSTHQIAAALGMTLGGVTHTMRALQIDVPANRIVGHLRQPNPDRILERMALDATHLCADINLIDFSSVHPDAIEHCVRAFRQAQRQMSAFTRRLIREQDRYAETADSVAEPAAASVSAQGAARPTRQDARASGAGDAAGLSQSAR